MQFAGRRVLVCDGDRSGREDLRRGLVGAGFEPYVTGGLVAARTVLLARGADCAVVDVALDDGDGLAAVAALRAVSHELPVIVTAAYNSREQEVRVRELDVFFYYVKGFDPAELIEAVRVAVRRGRRRDMQPRILVVDDDADYLGAIQLLLEAGGYAVSAARCQAEAMAKVTAERPDLVILDIMMDKATDGFHLLYAMRADPATADTPVLAVTAVSERSGIDFASTAGGEYFPADDYLAKPVKSDELLGRVRALLGRKSEKQEAKSEK